MKRFNNILCVVDASSESEHVLERAVTLAESNQAKLTVLNVTERVRIGTGRWEGGLSSSELQAMLEKADAQALKKLVSPYRKRVELKTKLLTGTPFLEVVREVLRRKHDLVIKHPERGDWLDHVIASDDMHLLRKCPCPVWLVKSESPKNYRCILAAVDVDDAYPAKELKLRQALNREILDLAVSLALSESAELHTVAAWRAAGESAMRGVFVASPKDEVDAYVDKVRHAHEVNLDTFVKEATGNLGEDSLEFLKPEAHLVKGLPQQVIPELAEKIEADIVVMGTVGRTGIPGLIMGNTAEAILNRLRCSVLAIKPSGFVTPVTATS